MASRTRLPVMVALILAGCSQRPEPQLYVMSPEATATETTKNPAEPVVAVIRVRLPDYLNRPQIVSRTGPNGLEINNDDRWGEPLDEAVPRVLAENLSHHLPGARVVVPQEALGQKIPYEYLVALDAYEPDGRGNAVMRGRWHLRDTRSGTVVAEGGIDERRPLASGAAADTVAALNQDLNDSSRQIADATARWVHR
ncbi:MAG: membrane integrity-associated transporter subunit PqiC [Solirubrobacterales bacterium]